MTEEYKKEIIRQFIEILSGANTTQKECAGRTRILINLDSEFSSELEIALRLTSNKE